MNFLSHHIQCDLVDALFYLASGTFNMLFGLALVFGIFLSWTSHQNFSISLFVTVVTLDLLLNYVHFGDLLLELTIPLFGIFFWFHGDYSECLLLLPSCVL